MKIIIQGGLNMKKKVIYVNVDEGKHQEIKEYAVRNKTDISNLVRAALDEYLKRGEADNVRGK